MSRKKKSPKPQSKRVTNPSWATAVVLSLVGIGVVVFYAYPYRGYLADDALISLQYAQRLLDGHGLTWTDGPRVEGYTNLLWVLIAAVCGAVGFDLVASVRVLGVVSSASVIPAIVYLYLRSNRASILSTIIPCLVWALAAPVAMWSFQGLETLFFAALLAWGLALVLRGHEEAANRRYWVSSLLFGFLCWTRTDGPLFVGVVALAVLLAGNDRKMALRRTLVILSVPVAMVLVQLAFRLGYYGEWLPNVARVKVSPSAKHTADGFAYIRSGAEALFPMVHISFLGLLVMLFKRSHRFRASALLLAGSSWIAYIIAMGGDVFPGWRHWVPAIAVAALGIGHVVDGFLESKYYHRRSLAVLIPALALAFVWYATHLPAQADSEDARPTAAWNGKTVGLILKEGFAEQQPTIAVTAAGGVPFWSGLPSIDLLGLNDHHIARHRPADFGQQWVGHELGDTEYLLQRQPDLVIFGMPGSSFAGNPRFAYAGLREDPRFEQVYSLCAVRDRSRRDLIAPIFFNRNSEKIGIVVQPKRVEIPPYFFKYMTVLDETGRFTTLIPPDKLISVKNIELSTGSWKIVKPGIDMIIKVDHAAENLTVWEQNDAGSRWLVLPTTGRYTVSVLSNSTGTVPFHGLTLQKF